MDGTDYNENERQVITAVTSTDDGKFDIFDLLYETSLPYQIVQPVLERFMREGLLLCENGRTFACTDAAFGLARKLSGGQTAADGENEADCACATDGEETGETEKEDEGINPELLRRMPVPILRNKYASACKELKGLRRQVFEVSLENKRLSDRLKLAEARVEAISAINDCGDDDDEDDGIDEEAIRALINGCDDGELIPEELRQADEFYDFYIDAFSVEAQEIMRAAYAMAVNYSGGCVDGVHILQAMVTTACTAYTLLYDAGVSATVCFNRIKDGDHDLGDGAGLNANAREILNRALKVAAVFGGKADTQHILLALLTFDSFRFGNFFIRPEHREEMIAKLKDIVVNGQK